MEFGNEEFVIHPVQAQSCTCDALISDHIPVISSFPTPQNTPSGCILLVVFTIGLGSFWPVPFFSPLDEVKFNPTSRVYIASHSTCLRFCLFLLTSKVYY